MEWPIFLDVYSFPSSDVPNVKEWIIPLITQQTFFVLSKHTLYLPINKLLENAKRKEIFTM